MATSLFHLGHSLARRLRIILVKESISLPFNFLSTFGLPKDFHLNMYMAILVLHYIKFWPALITVFFHCLKTHSNVLNVLFLDLGTNGLCHEGNTAAVVISQMFKILHLIGDCNIIPFLNFVVYLIETSICEFI